MDCQSAKKVQNLYFERNIGVDDSKTLNLFVCLVCSQVLKKSHFLNFWLKIRVDYSKTLKFFAYLLHGNVWKNHIPTIGLKK